MTVMRMFARVRPAALGWAWLLCSLACLAQNADAARQAARLRAMELAWNGAVQQRDMRALRLLLGADLIYVDYDSKLLTREQYIRRLEASDPAQVKSDLMQVRFYGSTAIVTGLYVERGTQNGKPYVLRKRFTDTWVEQGASWVCVASQATLVPE